MSEFAETIDLLVSKRGQLLAQIARVDAALLALRDAAGLIGEEASDMPDAAPRATSRERCAIPPADIARLARDVLIENRRPMKRGRLVKALEAKGVPLVGIDKAKNLGTILWRHKDDFVSLPGQGYWPKDVPCDRLPSPPQPR